MPKSEPLDLLCYRTGQQQGALNMATAKLATVQHATASKEHSLHDVRLLISEHLDIDARFVTSETHFIYDLGADFLDRIELMIAIEDRFDVEITDDDIEQFQVVGDLISHLARQQNAIGGAKPVP
jgi:acyl carrier protein